MRISTACMLTVLLACVSATAQESFPATHIARLDIMEPNPNAGTIGGVAIIAVNQGQSSQIRVSAAPQGDMPDTVFLLYRPATGSDIILARMPFPANSPTITTSIDLLLPSASVLAMADSGRIWLSIYKRNSPRRYAEGPVQSVPSAIAPEPSGAEVVPPVQGTDGVAHCGLTYDPVGNNFRYTAWWLDLTGPAVTARLHTGAPGSDGPPVFDIPLTPGSDESIGIWPNPTEQQRTAILNGEIYFEITTAAHLDGEIRGQIYPVEGFTAAIEPGNEVPAAAGTSASGSAYLLITAHGTNEVFNKLQGVIGNLSGPINAAHIHRGAMGQNGPPVVTLEQPSPSTIDLELASGSAGGAMSNEIVADIRVAGTYANVHTAAYQNGEARGQLIPARTRLSAPTGSVRTDAMGTVRFTALYDRGNQMIAFTTDAMTGTHDIAMYAADGRLVRMVTCEEMSCAMPTQGLPAGPYFVRLQNAGGSAVAACPVMIMP